MTPTSGKFYILIVATVVAASLAASQQEEQENAPQPNSGGVVRRPYRPPNASTRWTNQLQVLFTPQPSFQPPTEWEQPLGVSTYFSGSAADNGLNLPAGENTGIKGRSSQATHPPTVIYRSREGRTQNSYSGFSAKLFEILAARNTRSNVVYSPISLQMLLAYLSTVARGQTESEIQTALQLASDTDTMVEGFVNVLNAQRGSSGELVMANKMYYRKGLKLVANNVYDSLFNSSAEQVNFADPYEAAAAINAWVRLVTANRIQSLFEPEYLSSSTQAVLVNAIYFRAKWSTPFSSSDTEVQPFFLQRNRSVNVNMMYLEDAFRCADLKDLNAKAVELPYENGNMSMLLILPNEVEGLGELEQRLAARGEDYLKAIYRRLSTEPTVTVRLPRFKIEFGEEMVEAMRELGVNKLFTNEADLGKMFTYDPNNPVGVSKIKHKATLTVNEAGSEAAAASFVELIPLSLPLKQFVFTANHPFMFAIHGPDADVVYFTGHIVNPLIESY